MINFFRDQKETDTSIEEAEANLQECKLSLEQAASGTRAAALDLIGDLKSAVESREKKYQILVENIQDGMYILRDKKFIFANKSLCEMIGLPRHKIIGRTLKEIVEIREHYSDMIASNGSGHREYTIRYKIRETGQPKIVTVWETLSQDKDFAIEMGCKEADFDGNACTIAIGTVKDATDAVEKERMLKAFSSVINDSSDVIMVVSYPGHIMFVNDAFEKIYGYTNREVVDKNPSILKSGLHSRTFYRNMWDTLLCGQEWRGSVFNKAKNGTIVEDETKVIPFNNGGEKPLFFMAIKRIRKILTEEEAARLKESHAKLDTDFDTAHTGL